jgi:hypothetical protein
MNLCRLWLSINRRSHWYDCIAYWMNRQKTSETHRSMSTDKRTNRGVTSRRKYNDRKESKTRERKRSIYAWPMSTVFLRLCSSLSICYCFFSSLLVSILYDKYSRISFENRTCCCMRTDWSIHLIFSFNSSMSISYWNIGKNQFVRLYRLLIG